MNKRGSLSALKSEKQFIERIKNYPNAIIIPHEDAVQEGFEYFASDACVEKHPECQMTIGKKLRTQPPRILKVMAKNIRPMLKGKNECFTDADSYVVELEQHGEISGKLDHPEINDGLWRELTAYAWENWRVRMGFTALPRQLIFKGKAVLFPYALVCIQEMDRDKIMTAPEAPSVDEVMHVYATLGLAVNAIANWLREKGVKCQSNHPLGGLVDTTPLAAKAGLGWQGQNGLLITPEYGQRQRIAPIFLQNQIFAYTDSRVHDWIEDFCAKCCRCQRACPVQAIYHEKRVRVDGVDGIGQVRTCIDRIKCFPEFNRTQGCSVCVAVCPFSKGEGSYEKIKRGFMRNEY